MKRKMAVLPQALVAEGHRLLKLAALEPESELVTSYWLASPDGTALPTPIAGQYLPVAVNVPGSGVLLRTYTISAYDTGRYRISVKRERLPGQPPGRVSNHLHDHWAVGDQVSAGDPQGGFMLNTTSRRSIVLLAGGIGITPLMAMLRELALRDPGRKIVLIMGMRHHRDHPFRNEVAELSRQMPYLIVHVRYSEQLEDAPKGLVPDSFGFVDEALLRKLVPGQDVDVYLCGPGPFMNAMDHALAAMGVADERIRYESFGPATIERRRKNAPVAKTSAFPIVSFDRSGVKARFDPRALNLLEFAEDLGLNPQSNCRSGSCSACKIRKLSGSIRYAVEPTATVADDEVLICCALPAGPVTLDL